MAKRPPKKPAAEVPVTTDETDKMIAAFHTGFAASMDDEKDAFNTLPKVHDHTKGEFVEEVDPAKADG